MIRLDRIENRDLRLDPYPWQEVGDLFSAQDAQELVRTFPRDHYKPMRGGDAEKGWLYHVRSIIHMHQRQISFPESLSDAWRNLATDLLSDAYRHAMSMLTGYDLLDTPVEVNAFHYERGEYLGPHRDLPEKLTVHVLYFNRTWSLDMGGCLSILRSKDPADVAAQVLPVVGNSSVFVRSENSWHEVKPVARSVEQSRRSLVVTFYKPGFKSTMWPERE